MITSELYPPKKRKHPNIQTHIILMINGVVFVLMGLIVLFGGLIFRANAVHTTGEIIGLKEYQMDNKLDYSPIVKYTDTNGREYKLLANESSSPPIGKIGDEIHILYNKNSPSSFRIDSPMYFVFLPVVFLTIGSILLIIGIIMYKRKQARPMKK